MVVERDIEYVVSFIVIYIVFSYCFVFSNGDRNVKFMESVVWTSVPRDRR